MADYTEHSRIELRAVQATDATVDGQRMCWLGYDGWEEGCWLTHAEFREHVTALVKFADSLPPTAPLFSSTSCSSCGGEFGPGNAGFSHCDEHQEVSHG